MPEEKRMEKGKRHSVLIINDDPDYLELIKIGLSEEFDILNIGDFRTLREEIQEKRPSVIMVDKNSGESRAKYMIDFIQGLSCFKQIPILVLENGTGRNFTSESGFEIYKVKSHSFQEIRDRLHAILDTPSN